MVIMGRRRGGRTIVVKARIAGVGDGDGRIEDGGLW